MLLLGGCSMLQKTAPAIDWEQRRSALLQLDEWAMRGRIAVRDAAGQGGQASLSWQQQAEQSELWLAGPFGAGGVQLTVAPGRVSLRAPDNVPQIDYTGPDAAERLMRDHLGWSFPVLSARYWIRGLLDPAAVGDRQFGEAGELRGLAQHGWTVSFERFAEFDGHWLPVKLVLENTELRLKAVVSDWSTGARLD